MQRIALSIFPFLKSELFLPWEKDEFQRAIEAHISWLLGEKLLFEKEDGDILLRPKGGGEKDLQLRVMGHTLLQTFERYYITLAVLDKNGSGTLTRSELERLCFLTAQRMSQLNEFAAPEFSDRQMFKQFIALLREQGALTTNSEEKLEFNERIRQISEDANFILSEEIRHGIIRVAPQVLMHPDQE